MLAIQAEIRQKTGKSFSRKLRIQNKFPAVLYGANKTTIFLTLDHHSILNLQQKSEFYKDNLFLLVGEQKYQVKVKSIQRHSFKFKILHIDFLYV